MIVAWALARFLITLAAGALLLGIVSAVAWWFAVAVVCVLVACLAHAVERGELEQRQRDQLLSIMLSVIRPTPPAG